MNKRERALRFAGQALGGATGLAVMALTVLMWALAEHIWRHVIWWNFY